MKKQTKKPIVLTVVSGVCLVLMTAFSVGYGVTTNYQDVINNALHCESTKKIEVQSDKLVDSQYFKPSFTDKTDTDEANAELKEADKVVAERLTEEGAVLLKNKNNALPLSNTASVTILGHSSTNMLICGTGSADITANDAPTLKEALEARTGVKVNPTVWDYYAGLTKDGKYATNPKKGDNSIRTGDGTVDGSYTVNEVPWDTLTGQSGVTSSFDSYKDAAIVVISRLGGEMYDIPDSTAHKGNADESPTGNSLELCYNEIELINEAKKNFDHVVVLINSANPVECDFLTADDSGVDAALWIGYTGLMGLYSTADLLVGNANPSGRLVDTYCNDNTTCPAMENFYSEQWTNAAAWGKDMTSGGLDGNNSYNAYQEGIYVGYRYYETRYEDEVFNKEGTGDYDYLSDVAYPFGYGLSYTTFEQSTPKFKDNGDSITVTVDVTNTGSVAGKDVVEVYFQSEYTAYDQANGIEKAAVELCGFDKTDVIEPGKKETITIEVDKQEFRTYDAHGYGTYIMDAGNYYLTVGTDAHDALNNIIAKKGSYNQAKVKTIDNAPQGSADDVYSWNVAETDATTYSVSAVTGNKIENQLQSAELSYYSDVDENMKYLSRSSWTSTWPTHQMLELTQGMRDELTGCKVYVKEDTGEEMPTMGASNGKKLIQYRGVAYDDESWDDLLDQLTYNEMCRLVGMGYHGTRAIESVVKPETRDENGPQGFSANLTDITGQAASLCAYSDENIMAATWNTELMNEVGQHIGEDGLVNGYSGLYGPAMNTHRSAYAGRNFEYYSEDGFLAGKIGAAECAGIQSKGVYVFVKHFAFNDCETNCRSISTFCNEQALREVYLPAFEHSIVEGGAHNVMNAFARVGVYWSGAHKGLMTNILRGEWGMDGFAVSDYTTTGFATTSTNWGSYDPFLGVTSGTDTFDSSAETSQTQYLKRYDYKNDPHLVCCMRQAAHRILYTVVNSNAMNGISDNTVLLPIKTWWQYAIIDGIVYTGIAAVVCGALAGVKWFRYVKTKKAGETAEEAK